ncbi:FAD-dependent oxidoreductase [Thermodesulforhabdus norvegica]|uniref:2,4-dienoyl-CoA reductase n=1 Tax=Thermodesulforhabdus norvegica TaxID=39841 RepID=A0A1I4R3G5_9BACT|nr:FAD-dependent oxidoreductase [Thermodesulforhabdus norvegica]SFM46791.1 2,4-dienoyl-CoA reductase [Thermodesulforhabdus norvegica]
MAVLQDPVKLGNMELINRTVMAPMVPNMATEDGKVTEEYLNFYLARARNMVGYIVLGGVYVLEEGKGFKFQLGIDRDDKCEGLERLTESITPWTRIGVQLSYKGVGRAPQTYTLGELRDIRKAFAGAAGRARRCGFDAVELHGCHEYLINYFLSPVFNRRVDSYGGDIKNRMRLLIEILQEIKEATGNDLTIGVRLSVDDFVDNGLGAADILEVVSRLEELGVSYISASGGIGITQYRMSPPSDIPRGSLLSLARLVRSYSRLPVIGVGRLDRPEAFRSAVEDGYADLAAVARALIADHQYVKKVLAGETEEIRPCIACNHCLAYLHENRPIKCTVNPRLGRDLGEPSRLDKSKRILVIGGGPAGLTAATVAAKRGASVTLVEKQSCPGGLVRVASIPPGKDPLVDFIAYLEKKAREAGVKMLLGKEVGPRNLVVEGNTDRWDAIIVASGGKPILPGFAVNNPRVRMAEDVLLGSSIPEGRYLVVGAGMVGLETADFLVSKGRSVTVVDMLPRTGRGLPGIRHRLIHDRLVRGGAVILTRAKVTKIDERGAVFAEMAGREIELGVFDQIVIAVGYSPGDSEWKRVQLGIPVYLIGDVVEPRGILEAVAEGWEVASALK